MSRPAATLRYARPAALAALLACAGAGRAQILLEPEIPVEADARVLPVWSNASGKVEALLLLEPDAPRSSALDRVLTPRSSALGIGGRMTFDDGSRLHATLQAEPDAGLALLCNGSVGLSSTLGTLAQHCLLASLGSEDPLLSGAHGTGLQLGWESPSRALDLSFGLSWLDYQNDGAAAWNSAIAPGFAGEFALGPINTLGTWAQGFDSRSLRLESLVSLSPNSRLLIGGNLGRNRFTPAAGTPLQWDTTSLSVGLGMGDFSGQLTGRLIEVPGADVSWSGLDIGVSWRTPWRGELSVGARNVLGSGDTRNWPLTELPAIEDPSARVPYVRYQQDL
jgi:hypothetical protein